MYDKPFKLKQCFHYVFYSLLLLQRHRVCVKMHQNKPRLKNSTAPGGAPPPRFEIPGSATEMNASFVIGEIKYMITLHKKYLVFFFLKILHIAWKFFR